MTSNKPRIVTLPPTVPSHNNDSATFIGRVREVLNVIRGGRPSGPAERKESKES